MKDGQSLIDSHKQFPAWAATTPESSTQGSRCVIHVPTQRQMNLLGREKTLVRRHIEWVPRGEAGGGMWQARWDGADQGQQCCYRQTHYRSERSHYGERGSRRSKRHKNYLCNNRVEGEKKPQKITTETKRKITNRDLEVEKKRTEEWKH